MKRKHTWDYIHQEEIFDTNGRCLIGAISDGANCLFFAVSCDEPEGPEICRIFSSMTCCEESVECTFEWTVENDQRLLDCLAACGDDFCGEGSPIRTLFNDERQK